MGNSAAIVALRTLGTMSQTRPDGKAGRVRRADSFSLHVCPALQGFGCAWMDPEGLLTLMHLWNDYEGTTIAGRWTLGRLLTTEGRSALFATEEVDGSPAVLRLTEALNDQAVLAERYRMIQSAGDESLVTVRHFGDAEFDGTPLSYAVLEPTQESLADILAVRRLSVEETREVATSVAAALNALHAKGLVHGHVEPESVLAAGDRIKLRSDCARPAPAPEDEDLEGIVTQRTDALGLADVIYRALTQKRLQDAADALALPEPFASIVRNTVRGSWGVAEIQAELSRPVSAARPVAPVVSTVSSTPAAPVVSAADGPAPVAARAAVSDAAWQQPEQVAPDRRKLIGIVVAALVVILLLFALLHHPAHRAPMSRASQSAASGPDTSNAPATAPAAPPAAVTSAPPHSETTASAPASGQSMWRVIAFDYNRQQQAAAKAAAINSRFPDFHAEVWSRTGHRPFLVTLGGAMSREQAFALRARARKAGVARDVYAQNYRQ